MQNKQIKSSYNNNTVHILVIIIHSYYNYRLTDHDNVYTVVTLYKGGWG